MPEHPIVLSQYPRSAASEFRFKAVDHKLRRTGRIGRGMVNYVHSLLHYSRGGNDRPDFTHAPLDFLFTFGAGQTTGR